MSETIEPYGVVSGQNGEAVEVNKYCLNCKHFNYPPREWGDDHGFGACMRQHAAVLTDGGWQPGHIMVTDKSSCTKFETK